MEGLKKAAAAATLAAGLALGLLGCQSALPTATPDIPATVSVQVDATVAAIPTALPTPDIPATVSVQVDATVAAIPTALPTPDPVRTRIAMNQSINSTVAARIQDWEDSYLAEMLSPTPTRTPAEAQTQARVAYRCLSQHPDFWAAYGDLVGTLVAAQGLTSFATSIDALWGELMSDEETFVRLMGRGDMGFLDVLTEIRHEIC